MMNAVPLDEGHPAAFDYFRSELKRRVGIAISDNKGEMIRGRLRKHMAQLHLAGFDEYAAYLKSLPEHDPEWETFINCLTTNKTDFFREAEHFQYLTQDIIPEWRKEGQSEFNVWCAASSTGEEPYTLSMVLQREAKARALRYTILSTDIDSEVLERARRGVYPTSKLDEIPADYRRESVAVGTGDISKWFKIKDDLRSAMGFQRCNLVQTPYNLHKKFDVVFCRNVLIYFTPETIAKVAEGIYDVTRPGGYLIIGHSESLHNIASKWQYIKPSVYRKKG